MHAQIIAKHNNDRMTKTAQCLTVLVLLPPFYVHYTGQPVLAGTPSQELEDSVPGKFYCPHALADGN